MSGSDELEASAIEDDQRSNYFESRTHMKGNGEGSSIVGSALSVQSNNSTIASTTMRTVQTGILTFILALQDKSYKKSKRFIFISILYHLYIIWTSIFLPTLGEYNWGEYGSWIFKALNYPITFSLDLVPYEESAAIAGVIMAVILLGLFFVSFSAWTVYRNSKLVEKMKVVMAVSSLVFSVLSKPFAFVLAGFIDCDFSKTVYFEDIDDNTNALSRFQTVACFGGNTYLYALSIISMLAFSLVILSTHFAYSPSWRSKVVFHTVVGWPITYLVISNMLEIYLIFFIPKSEIWARATLHLVAALTFVPMILITLPFQRRIENSFYLAVAFAKVGSSIGSLISSLVNSNNKWDLGLGMSGLTIGLIILGFCVGFIVMELYILRTMAFIRHKMIKAIERGVSISDTAQTQLSESAKMGLEREATNIYSSLHESQSLNKLKIFIRFNIIRRSKQTKAILDDTDMCLAFIKGVSHQKTFNDPSLILFSSLLIYVNHPDESNSSIFANSLLKKTTRVKLSFFEKVTLGEVTKELNISKNGKVARNTTDLESLLVRVDSNFSQLKSLHKSFWKEFLQDVVDTTNLEVINSKCAQLMADSENIFHNRISRYKNNKTFLRSYARFLDEIKFDKDQAAELFQEAATMEEEELATKRRRQRKFSRVVPYDGPVVSVEPPAFSLDGLRKGTNEPITNLMDDDFDDHMLDGVENEPATKREYVFKAALAQKTNGELHVASVVMFCLLSFAIILVSLVLNVYYSEEVLSNVKFVQQVCEPTVSSYAILKQIRNNQILIQAKNQGIGVQEAELIDVLEIETDSNITVTSLNEIWKERLNFYVEHIEHVKKMSQGKIVGKFTPEMYEDYNSETNEVFVPVIQTKNQNSFIEVIKKNVSLSEISSLLIDIVENYPSGGYNETLKEYDFMLVFLNRETFTNAFVKTCFSFLERCELDSVQFDNTFLYFFVGSACFYILSSLIYIIYIRIQFTLVANTLALYERHLTKDLVGKIYQELGKNVDENSTTSFLKSFITKPKVFSFVCILSLAFLTILASSMMFLELRLNSDLGFSTMLSVRKTAESLVLAQSIGHKLNEQFISTLSSSIYNDPLLVNNSTMNLFRYEVRYNVTDFRRTYNELIYGKIGVSPTILGAIPKIDEIITGTDCTAGNCTSLENTVDEFTIKSSKYNEDLMKGVFSPEELILKNTVVDGLVHHLCVDLLEFLALFTIARSTPSTIIALLFGIFGFSAVVLFFGLLNKVFHNHWNDIFHLRNMLNYVGYDHLDSSDPLRNYALYNQLPGKNIFKKKNKIASAEGDESKVRNILNAAVDGAVLCNSACDIEIFNPAAQRMFGCKQSDTLGTPIFTLFDKESRTELERVISDLIKNAKSTTSSESLGETVELDCVRKNLTKFPAKINLFSTLFDGKPVVTCFIKDATSEKKQNALLAEEKKKSENLLRSILPESVANRLKSGETFIAEKFADITCFFSDMVGFTQMSSTLNPTQLVGMLNNIVNGFDALTDKYSLEKIKTIGDAYFCVGGIGNTQSDHPERMLRFSMDIFQILRTYNEQNRKEFGHQINIRVGVNTGSAVAGVIGTKKFAYDLWGDTINTASRMESTSIAGRIQISRSTYERVYDMGLEFEERSVEAKGKGLCLTYLVKSHHHAQAIITDDVVDFVPEEEKDEQDLEVSYPVRSSKDEE
ncbi:predicted protein [Naegleria gruberi]|uniref:Predicted protein n=1 Tax=Naegleria gruberi TaxID=5762 RepID=D2V6Y4_NAEGR|nr:uncharacterized protein NAEGRDRAFT_47156 [Naegleria gruberi]EFC47530.1 predicted protein [Naegleria gruberi]|eukprot:XP_002680274.1 predicted protein [Naegleria gruberi strain NEG-M]